VVTTKVAYLAIGVDLDGRKQALGCWIADTESAKFWQKVVTDLRNRGVRDILIACCDGLTGLPDAIRSMFPQTVVQTCTVHLLTELAVLFSQFRLGVVRVPRCDRVRGAAQGSGWVGGARLRVAGGDRAVVGAVAAA